MNGADRHVYGPRSIGALLPRITRPAFRKRAPAAAQVIADWDAIMGPALAAVTVPRRLAAGTLVISCSGPIALELQHLSAELIERINTHLGRPTVRGLRFVQDARKAPMPAPTPALLSPPVAARAEAAVADLPDGPVREALLALGRSVLARNRGPSGSRY
jgi:hypothetical protein